MWKLYEIQIAYLEIKFFWNTATSTFCILWGSLLYKSELYGCGTQNLWPAKPETVTLWPYIEKLCWPPFIGNEAKDQSIQ